MMNDNQNDKYICSKCLLYLSAENYSPCKRAKLRNGLSYVCKKCQAKEQKERREQMLETDTLDYLLKKRLYDALNRGKLKNMYCDIDLEFMRELWNKQKGKCALTGIQMTTDKHGRTNTNVSIDRIDSTKGYTKDNVQLVCSVINFMKSNLKLSDFEYYCKAIVDYKK